MEMKMIIEIDDDLLKRVKEVMRIHSFSNIGEAIVNMVDDVVDVWIERPPVVTEEVTEPVILPEGLETVPFELVDEANAEQVETMFLAMVKDTHEFRSAVNIGKDVRTVMYEKGKKYGGTRIHITTVSVPMAWSLQQTIDWCLLKQISVVAVRRKGAIVEVGYIKKGIPEPPSRETYIHYFEKTDGWTVEKHERKR